MNNQKKRSVFGEMFMTFVIFCLFCAFPIGVIWFGSLWSLLKWQERRLNK